MPTWLTHYFLLFFLASVLGWLMEVCCKLIQFHRFINRGFLIGPYCPIYGFGAVLVTALLSPYANSPLVVFVLAVVVCGVLEYATSYLMEKLFHARWWDYSQKRFQLNGRVCADTLIPFGLLGLTMVYLVKPFLFRALDRLPSGLLTGLTIGLAALMLTDTVLSTRVLTKIRSAAESIRGDSTEAITAAVRRTLAQEGALVRRALQAFPHVHLYNRPLLEKLKAARKQFAATHPDLFTFKGMKTDGQTAPRDDFQDDHAHRT